MYKKLLGSCIKKLRNSKKLSQANVADLIGVSRTTYLRYEGGTHMPSLEQLFDLANIFNVSIYDILKPILLTDFSHTNQSLSDYDEYFNLENEYKLLNNNEKSYILSIMHTLNEMHS